jgi:hypothetical protein
MTVNASARIEAKVAALRSALPTLPVKERHMPRSGVDIAEIASLIGDVACGHMLAALHDGRADGIRRVRRKEHPCPALL